MVCVPCNLVPSLDRYKETKNNCSNSTYHMPPVYTAFFLKYRVGKSLGRLVVFREWRRALRVMPLSIIFANPCLTLVSITQV